MEKKEEVSITQVNPQTDFNDTEKTAIMQYAFDKKQEELSKTQKFRLLNDENRDDHKVNLSDTIKLKLSDLREKIDEEHLELPVLSKKKSLYDTVIIKLDDLINRKNAIKYLEFKRVTSIEEQKQKKKHFFQTRNHKIDNRINLDKGNLGCELYHLNKIALDSLTHEKSIHIRKSYSTTKLKSIENIPLTREEFQKYKHDLNKFAINKLYYKMAPKEPKKYTIYKYSLFFTGILLVIFSFLLMNWFIQGRHVLEISHSLQENIQVEQMEGGELFNTPLPIENQVQGNEETSLYYIYKDTPLSSVDINQLKISNSDTIGWLIVPNTNVNYPVVQTTDNTYYLNHSYDKTVNQAGWVFADFRNDFTEFSDNSVIYAHGRKDKVMFGSLTNALLYSWYSVPENQIIQFSTEHYNTMWQIFSIYKIEAESYYITTDFSSKESFLNFLNTMKNRSIYDFGISLTEEDKILTLSTCYNDNGIRLVIQAKLVKTQKR